MMLIMSLCKSYMDPHLSRAALLLSTNSTDDGSSIPTFTLVIPVGPNDTCHTEGIEKQKSAEPKKRKKGLTPTYNTFLWWWWNDASME